MAWIGEIPPLLGRSKAAIEDVRSIVSMAVQDSWLMQSSWSSLSYGPRKMLHAMDIGKGDDEVTCTWSIVERELPRGSIALQTLSRTAS